MNIRERIKNVIVKNLIEARLSETTEGEINPAVEKIFTDTMKKQQARKAAVAKATGVRPSIHNIGTATSNPRNPIRGSKSGINKKGAYEGRLAKDVPAEYGGSKTSKS